VARHPDGPGGLPPRANEEDDGTPPGRPAAGGSGARYEYRRSPGVHACVDKPAGSRRRPSPERGYHGRRIERDTGFDTVRNGWPVGADADTRIREDPNRGAVRERRRRVRSTRRVRRRFQTRLGERSELGTSVDRRNRRSSPRRRAPGAIPGAVGGGQLPATCVVSRNPGSVCRRSGARRRRSAPGGVGIGET
jgi:hypothetical protein